MDIKEYMTDGKVLLRLKGRLDTVTFKKLEEVLNNFIDDINELIFDFTELSYISSAGLRILLVAQKKMIKGNSSMYIENANDIILDILEITGFNSILTVNTGYLAANDIFNISPAQETG